MFEPVATAGDGPGLGAARPPPILDEDGESLSAPPRRVTAESFRTLMARLGVKPAAERAVVVPAPPVGDTAREPSAPGPVAADGETDLTALIEPVAEPQGAGAQHQPEAARGNGALPAPEDARASDVPGDIVWEPAAPQDRPEADFKPDELASEPDDPLPSIAERPASGAEPARITIDLNFEPLPALDGADLIAPLAARLGPASRLLKRSDSAHDPFALPRAIPLPPLEISGPDPASAELTRSLLEIMSAPTGASQPQERALAADTLLRLIPKMTESALVALSERASLMETAPPLLVASLIRDPRPEVAAPLLERGGVISDQDLIAVIGEGDAAKQRMIACRRIVSPALADALIATGEPSVLLALLRNAGASLSHEAFYRLSSFASRHAALQAPLATRADTPAPVVFELFWSLPAELRRYVLSRFLTDSETLSRILKIALTVDGIGAAQPARPAPKRADPQRVEELILHLEQARIDGAAALLVEIGGICDHSARRILADTAGEALTVMLKALGLSRARFAEVLERLHASPLHPLDTRRPAAELKAIFDTLSFSKTRVLLTYWDWAAQKTGPYARLAA